MYTISSSNVHIEVFILVLWKDASENLSPWTPCCVLYLMVTSKEVTVQAASPELQLGTCHCVTADKTGPAHCFTKPEGGKKIKLIVG